MVQRALQRAFMAQATHCSQLVSFARSLKTRGTHRFGQLFIGCRRHGILDCRNHCTNLIAFVIANDLSPLPQTIQMPTGPVSVNQRFGPCGLGVGVSVCGALPDDVGADCASVAELFVPTFSIFGFSHGPVTW